MVKLGRNTSNSLGAAGSGPVPCPQAGARRPKGTEHGPSWAEESDWRHLRRCVELAEEALASGDQAFGSVPAAKDGTCLAEDRPTGRHRRPR